MARIVSVPELVRVINESMDHVPKMVAEINAAFSMYVIQCSKMTQRADDLLAVLASDMDEAQRAEQIEVHSDTFGLVIGTMRQKAKDGVGRVAALRKECDVCLLGVASSISGIAQASLLIANGLGNDVVGPVKSAATLATKLCDDFFGPILKKVDALEEAMPRVLLEVKKVMYPKGTDIPSWVSEAHRVKAEFETLGEALKTFTVQEDLQAILDYLQGAKPIVELFDV